MIVFRNIMAISFLIGFEQELCLFRKAVWLNAYKELVYASVSYTVMPSLRYFMRGNPLPHGNGASMILLFAIPICLFLLTVSLECALEVLLKMSGQLGDLICYFKLFAC